MKLCVNVDHVATVREARKIHYPDPVEAALIALKGGAHGITIHLREDRRHIQDHDLKRLKKTVTAKLNLEMAATREIIDIALKIKPDQVTFVPEKREEVTTEGGLDVAGLRDIITECVGEITAAGIPVSLFIDADESQIEASRLTGAESIEINTGSYSECVHLSDEDKEFELIKQAASLASGKGLIVYAGHGLNYQNTRRITGVPEIEELNIGHSIVAHSIFVGMEQAVKEMLKIMV